jgi:hypothetical protein
MAYTEKHDILKNMNFSKELRSLKLGKTVHQQAKIRGQKVGYSEKAITNSLSWTFLLFVIDIVFVK